MHWFEGSEDDIHSLKLMGMTAPPLTAVPMLLDALLALALRAFFLPNYR